MYLAGLLNSGSYHLNPLKLTIGLAKIIQQNKVKVFENTPVENIYEISDAIIVGKPNNDDVELVLCVKLNEGSAFDENLIDQIKALIRMKNTPRHVPKYVFEVADIPYTISGKKVEKAVLSAIIGEKIKNKDALANPESLKEYSNLPF